MKNKLSYILFFIILIMLYFLPSVIYKSDEAFYNSLILPPYAPKPFVFMIAWSLIYGCLSIFIVLYIYKKNYSKKEIILLLINYILMFFFPKAFFKDKNLYLAFALTLLAFLSMFFIYFNVLKENRKISTLLVPYLLWTLFATILMGHIYLLN